MTQEEIKQMQEAFAAFKAANDALHAEVKSFGAASGETKGKVEALHTVLDGLEAKINSRMDRDEFTKGIEAVQARLDGIEAMVRRKGAHSEDVSTEQALAKAAFFEALRFNPNQSRKSLEETLGPDKFKALMVSDDTAGGYLAPAEYVMEIIKNAVEFAALRNICRVRTTTRTSVQMPKRTTTAVASWVEETGTRTETQNPAFGMFDVPTREMYAMCKVSWQELEDSAFDLEQFLREEFGEQFGVAEAEAFVNGNGVAKPEGLLSSASIDYVPGGDASALVPDGLIALYYDLKEVYLANATWVMNRSTLKTIRQMKDQQDQYLWAPGIRTDGRPAVILDRPYITAPEMPTVGANAYPVLFGDFRRGYLIVDRLVMQVMNDPYSSKATGMVEFSARKRVGGKTILPEAIRKLKIATS